MSDLEFSFIVGSSDGLDEELLPDLTDDSSHSSPLTPLAPRHLFFGDSTRRSLFPSLQEVAQDPGAQSLKQAAHIPMQTAHTPIRNPSTPLIFDIPELVHTILSFADAQNTVVPQESTPIRRRPLSYQHALLIYGDAQLAQNAMKNAPTVAPAPTSVLHTCLQVNRLFNHIARDIIGERLLFSDEQRLLQFIDCSTSSSRTKVLVLHKLFHTRQTVLEKVAQIADFLRLEWLELYMCPKLVPPAAMLGPHIRKLVITGSRTVDDALLAQVAQKCPRLEVLDVRACEHVLDAGLHAIAGACTQLHTINVGRKNRGHLVTDAGVCELVRNNPNLTTVGLAGCHVTDRLVWQLAASCNNTLARLLLNNCPYITDALAPAALANGCFPNLLVLELRFTPQITCWRPVIEFRRRQELRGISVLVEVCEPHMRRMREQELAMDREISQRIFDDIGLWVNSCDDDRSWQELARMPRISA